MQSRKLFFLVLIFSQSLFGQAPTTGDVEFRILHTELHLEPIWSNSQLKGYAKLKVQPYFYSKDTLKLDARGFIIDSDIKLNTSVIPNYQYDGEVLRIPLGKNFKNTEVFEIEIKYVAQPNSIKVKGSNAILSDKGLYFINPQGTNKNLPRQLWTQGETQANSCWFPTIDSPNQKHTQDVYLNVEKSFTTLSNGALVETKASEKTNYKIDHWQLTNPHSVYLTMIAVGDFRKVVDPNFTRFEVSYYVEPFQVPYAQAIFGRTGEMIRFFEQKLGVPYAWNKYSQILVRNFVSGAMENTTATVHGKYVGKNPNQLVDETHDDVIAHELFHHWFGDLVTCKSWSHLPLNESFANYSEYLWAEYKDGKDEADNTYIKALNEYLQEAQTKQEPLIRPNLKDREDMFDAHSYQKGGRVLHLLRMEVGDEAFFKSLNSYLVKYRFQNTEIDNLKKCFEEVTGKDLAWFFDQWFMKPGHPTVVYNVDISGPSAFLQMEQRADSLNNLIYNLQIPVLIKTKSGSERQILRLTKESEEFKLTAKDSILAVYPNPDGYFLGTITMEDPTIGQNIARFDHAESYFMKQTSLAELLASGSEEQVPMNNPDIAAVMKKALKDPNWRVRQTAIGAFSNYDGEDFLEIERTLQGILRSDKNSNVRNEAILSLSNFLNPQNDLLFRESLADTSYKVRGSALNALLANNVSDVKELITRFEGIQDVNLFSAVASYYQSVGDSSKVEWFKSNIENFEGEDKYIALSSFGSFSTLISDQYQKELIPYFVDFSRNSQEWYIKMAGMQTLIMLLEFHPDLKPVIKDIADKETQPKLVEMYKSLKDM
ncbi:MAG: M1 family aminopeptidase [Leadbetterella sp.]